VFVLWQQRQRLSIQLEAVALEQRCTLRGAYSAPQAFQLTSLVRLALCATQVVSTDRYARVHRADKLHRLLGKQCVRQDAARRLPRLLDWSEASVAVCAHGLMARSIEVNASVVIEDPQLRTG
jgi:hypothetical protein